MNEKYRAWSWTLNRYFSVFESHSLIEPFWLRSSTTTKNCIKWFAIKLCAMQQAIFHFCLHDIWSFSRQNVGQNQFRANETLTYKFPLSYTKSQISNSNELFTPSIAINYVDISIWLWTFEHWEYHQFCVWMFVCVCHKWFVIMFFVFSWCDLNKLFVYLGCQEDDALAHGSHGNHLKLLHFV